METPPLLPTREQLIHALYEAAELEHNLMCTYLYAAFSLKDETEVDTPEEADAVKRWRRAILDVAIEEMGHLAAVWNITSAVGGSPRFGRVNFPIDPGYLPAGIVVKLAPFSEDVLQHFISGGIHHQTTVFSQVDACSSPSLDRSDGKDLRSSQ